MSWSLDDSILLSSSEQYIKMWNTKVPSRTRLDMPMYIETIFSDWFMYTHTGGSHRDGVGASMGT